MALKASEKKATTCLTRNETDERTDNRLLRYELSPKEMRRLLVRLQSIKSSEDDLLSAYVRRLTLLPPDLEKDAASIKSEKGLAVLCSPQLFTLFLVPPLPLQEFHPTYGSAFQLHPLEEVLETPLLLISAHAGDTLLGLALSHEGFEECEIVESQVKEKHSKGGWSQKRFERLREEDIQNHADAVVHRLSEMAGRYRSIAKYAILGGDPILLKVISPHVGVSIIERRLARHDSKKTDKLLDEVYGFRCYRS